MAESEHAPRLLREEDLPGTATAWRFEGHEHGATASFFLSHNTPGTGPPLHRHPYEEIFIVQEGEVLFTVGETTVEAGAGDIVIVPPGAPHKFESRGRTHRQVSIHPAANMETDWLE